VGTYAVWSNPRSITVSKLKTVPSEGEIRC
jgi:hypothetical protein